MNNIIDDYFDTVASLGVPRAYHSATVQFDGRVLVAGGLNEAGRNQSEAGRQPEGTTPTLWQQLDIGASASISDVERYDASADAWSLVSPLIEARADHCAVCLHSGQIMIIAGSGSRGTLDSVELYNPSKNCWTATQAMSTPRFAHTATVLDTGLVMVCAGNNLYQGEGHVLDSVEIYDPICNGWTVAPSIPVARMNHSATLLASGEVLVLGGYSATRNAAIDDASLFDPVNRTWRNVKPLPQRRMQHTATRLKDGQVLVVGGTDEPFDPGREDAYLYDPNSDSWSAPMPMAYGRIGHSVTQLCSGRVLVVGCASNDEAAFVTEVFDPVSHHWTVSAVLETARFTHTASLLCSGRVLVAAGQRVTSHPSYVASAELFTEG